MVVNRHHQHQSRPTGLYCYYVGDLSAVAVLARCNAGRYKAHIFCLGESVSGSTTLLLLRTNASIHISLRCSIDNPSCRSVLLTAKALGLEISLLPIDLLHGEQLDHEFLEIHIEHTLPTKQKDTLVLSERNTIETSNISLYYSLVNPPCRSVLLTAKALHLEFDLRPTRILHGGQTDPELVKINFQHTLPTIQGDNFVLWKRMITESTKVSPKCRSILLTLIALNIGLNELPIEFIEHASNANTSKVSFRK
ncbi:hypothetical protein ACI65C_000023 [Semiaphis heraclei]